MIEQRVEPQVKESLRTFKIEEFKPELLSGLTNWALIQPQSGGKWTFAFVDLNDGNNMYIFEIAKFQHPNPSKK